MDITEALNHLRPAFHGYALWVGAGVSLHMATGATQKPLDWQTLTADLETAAGLQSPSFTATLAERIEVALQRLGRQKFQAALRRKILVPLANAVVETGMRCKDADDIVPRQIRQLAALGTLANPIVNFNIETMTSCALVRPTSLYQIKAFTPPGNPRDDSLPWCREPRQGFRRHVLHPHGAIDKSGACVIAQSEYDSLKNTLAFQVATHAAFESTLVIVGMSLDDEYLRQHLTEFRRQLRTVLWFTDRQLSEDLLRWAWSSAISVVPVSSWPDFWAQIESLVSEARVGPSELNLLLTYWDLVMQSSLTRADFSLQSYSAHAVNESDASEESRISARRLAMNCVSPFSTTLRNS